MGQFRAQNQQERSFSELRDQKSEYVTHCHEQLCGQESGQARQMDRGEIEVEEASESEARASPPDRQRER